MRDGRRPARMAATGNLRLDAELPLVARNIQRPEGNLLEDQPRQRLFQAPAVNDYFLCAGIKPDAGRRRLPPAGAVKILLTRH